ncbi:MAG: anti-sigma factor domain-containing protein [Aminipila sp.]
MYLKVMVLEIKEEYCLVMTDDGEILRISKKDGIKIGDCIFVLTEDLYNESNFKDGIVVPFKNNKIKPSVLRRVAAVAVVIAIVFTCFIVPNVTTNIYATDSLDGQKGVQLQLDKDFKVIGAVSYDGSVSESHLQALIGHNITDLQEDISSLIVNNSDSLIVGYGLMKSKAVEKEDSLKACLKKMFGSEWAIYLKGNKKDIETAKKQEENLGIYIAQKVVKGEELEDILEDMPMDKLLIMLQKQPSLMKNKEVMDVLKDRLEDLEDNDDIDKEDDNKTIEKETLSNGVDLEEKKLDSEITEDKFDNDADSDSVSDFDSDADSDSDPDSDSNDGSSQDDSDD